MDREHFNRLLAGAVQHNASDIHFRVGSAPMFRVRGSLRQLKQNPLTAADTLDICRLVITDPVTLKDMSNLQDYDTAIVIPGLARFRINIYRQRGSMALVLRVISETIPTFQDLLLPPQMEELAMYERGLVLITGAAGTGKSSTLAAVIRHINEHKADHIITIEDPIEFVHRDIQSSISQREVGPDTKDFNKALRAALRQNPDVILVGEMRDLETIDIALKAAETGHMVYSTVHTPDATRTVGRLIAMFPQSEQAMVRVRLAENLRATMSQRLIPRADGNGMVAATEIMKVTGSVEDAIRNADLTGNLKDIIERSREQYGMMSFDQCLTDLYKGGLITLDVARRSATNSSDFERALNFE